MTFNPTLRRSGSHMVTIRTSHYVGREVVENTIVTEFWEEYGTSGENLSRIQVETAVRDAYRAHGGEWDITASDLLVQMDDEERAEAEEWAAAQITRLYPRWRP